jgi:3'-phosphoadenosine 5'-phosphosulfate sulfotransferase (PAPS reductase)/FAD synthetase
MTRSADDKRARFLEAQQHSPDVPATTERPMIDCPSIVVNFSGGRSSGYMLHKLLPQIDDCVVLFQNTGLEHESTLEFVEEVAQRWGVPIVWLEYRIGGYAKVDFATASRRGEPFSLMISKKQYLPNPRHRLCTANLKVAVAEHYLRDQGIDKDSVDYALGLRADEPRRVANARKQANVVLPLADDNVSRADVLAWWSEQPFDLRLPNPHAGNCVGCFLKGRQALDLLMRDEPDHFAWWVKMEQLTGNRFRNDRPDYSSMMTVARTQQLLPMHDDDDSLPCLCHE